MKISKHWGPQSEGLIMLENEMYGKANVQAHSLKVFERPNLCEVIRTSFFFEILTNIKFITLEDFR